jgi:proteic killer suppression protein
MWIEFTDDKLKRQCETERLARKAWGAEAAKQLVKRLNQLRAAPNLDVFRSISPHSHPHPLLRRRVGQWGVRIHGGLRLIFQPLNPPEEYTKADGGVDWRRITKITILEIEDYHDERR